MDRGDGSQNDVALDDLDLALLQQEDFQAIHSMLPWLQIDLLRGLVVNQLPQHEEAVDVPAGGIEINPPQEIEGPWDNNGAEIGAGDDIERNPPQEIEGPWYNNGAENGAGDFELNPGEQAEDLIIEEMSPVAGGSRRRPREEEDEEEDGRARKMFKH
ncbi:4-hydroxybenzoate polyprenyltransferase [Sarotherodon galilaeus]